jgi:hypothetical protein
MGQDRLAGLEPYQIIERLLRLGIPLPTPLRDNNLFALPPFELAEKLGMRFPLTVDEDEVARYLHNLDGIRCQFEISRDWIVSRAQQSWQRQAPKMSEKHRHKLHGKIDHFHHGVADKQVALEEVQAETERAKAEAEALRQGIRPGQRVKKPGETQGKRATPRLAKGENAAPFRPRHKSFGQVEDIAKGLLKATRFSDFNAFAEQLCRQAVEQVKELPDAKTLEQRWAGRFWAMRRQTKWLNTG